MGAVATATDGNVITGAFASGAGVDVAGAASGFSVVVTGRAAGRVIHIAVSTIESTTSTIAPMAISSIESALRG